jgi:AcrR family transcriptional regulator
MTSTASSAADMAVLSTRERILAEALQLFAESGYGGASMRELARRVGVRESSLYNHFAGKAAILEAIVSAYGPASSASRLEEPRYRQLSRQPAAFCGQFALDLVAQWSDPREHQFQKVITAERNRVPGYPRRNSPISSIRANSA